MRVVTLLSVAILAFTAGCAGYRPGRFAARPPVADADDESPIPVPRWRWVPESVYLSEVYLHRPVREALDLSPYPEAGDVNSHDEVVRSSWFEPRVPDIGAMARGDDHPGPPLPPFTVLSETPFGLHAGAFVIRDSRGQKYDVGIDPADRPEMRTAAGAIASRLFWALGYNTPPVIVFRARADDFWRSEGAVEDVQAVLHAGAPAVDGYYRLSALAWPPGMLLGYAPESGVRGDDPNDLVPHQNRRSVRALKVFAAWLALDGLGPAKTIDRYVGAPGEGHVVHYVAGLDDALGAASVVRVSDPPPGEGGGSPFTRLLTLGLFPNRAPEPTQIEMPAVGELSRDVDPASFSPPLPYEPADRLVPSDGYWAAKRMLALSSSHIALAIDAGKIGDPRAQRFIQSALESRRARIAKYWFGRVTPVEVVTFLENKIVLRDEAVQNRFVEGNITDYKIEFLTSDGDRLDAGFTLHPQGSVLLVSIPPRALVSADGYLVLQVSATRGRGLAARALELHLRLHGERPVVVGIRH